jgi:CHAT domain-containing protein
MAAAAQIRNTIRVAMAILLTANFFVAVAQTRDERIAAAMKLMQDGGQLVQGPVPTAQIEGIEKVVAAEKVFEELGEKELAASAYSIHGSLLMVSGSLVAAGELMNRSLTIFRSTNNNQGQAGVLVMLFSLARTQEDYPKARDFIEEARAKIELHPFPPLDLTIYQALGSIYIDLNEPKKAVDALWTRYQLAKDRSDSEAVDALRDYARAQIRLGAFKNAVSYFEFALNRSRFGKLPAKEVEILNDLGSLYLNELEDRVMGKDLLEQALKKSEATSDEKLKAVIYYNLGYCEYQSFRIPEALAFYERANVIARRIGATGVEANIANNVGLVYRSLGDSKRSIPYFEDAIRLGRQARDRAIEMYALRYLGGAYAALLDEKAAVEKYSAAMALANENVKRRGLQPELRKFVIGVLLDFGEFALKARRFPMAMDIYTTALAKAREWEERSNEAALINNIAKVHELQGDIAKALPMYNASLSLERELGATYGEATTLDNLMGIWTKLGNPNFAIFYGKSSVNIFQEFRKGLVGLDNEQRQGFLKTAEGTYRRLAGLLVAQGRIAEAEQVLTMLKEEELIDYVRRDDAVAKSMLEKLALTDDERAAITRYEAVAGQLTSMGKEFSDLEAERLSSTSTVPFSKQQRYDELKKSLGDATLAFQKFLEELKTKFGQNDGRVVQVDSGLKSTLDRLKANRTAVVSTIVGDDTLNIIVTTRKTQRAHTIKVTAAEINDLVVKFRSALTSPQYDPRPAGQKLYDLIVKPIEGDLAGIKADTIVWSLDGTLRYMPPAALWDKKRGYVAERYANVIVNLASRDTIGLPVPSGQKLSVLGVGVSKAIESFSALAAVPDELDCIVSDKTAGTLSAIPQCRTGVLAGRKLLDESFTLTNFENEIGRYPIIHVASHFKLTPGDDKNSFLLLGGGDDRKFTVEKLRSEPLTDVELIVLSACNTATPGGSKTNGVEIEGFASIAQKEGAKSVMATLWSVADRSTKDFMVEFYRLYGNEGQSKADAMRKAQLKLLYGTNVVPNGDDHRSDDFVEATDGSLPKYKPDPNAPFAHPFYWSPFVLIGNWR